MANEILVRAIALALAALLPLLMLFGHKLVPRMPDFLASVGWHGTGNG